MNDEKNINSPGLSSLPAGGGQGILSLLVAVSENNVIGKNNKLPWNLPSDLLYFKNQSWGMPVIMGRKSFESVGKPLRGRKNIVITRNNDWKHDGADVVHSIDEATEKAKEFGAKEIFVIGGAEIFKTVLPRANRIYLTRIHHQFDGDAYFPEVSTKDWNLIKSHFCHADEKNKYSHTFQVWQRK